MATAAVDLQLPAGFRFHPTDEELVMHYLCRKCASRSIGVPIVAEINLYKYDPWDLPGMALYGEKEWYFFSPRDRKYPNGSRPNRSAGCGYWKATGADKPIGNPKTVGIKKALVFYSGKAPKGVKTNWIMHEYRLADVDRKKSNGSLRLDDWVLCRIYNKKGNIERQRGNKRPTTETTTTTTDNDENEHVSVTTAAMAYDDCLYLDGSDSIPSSSDHPSPESASFQKAAESEWENFLLEGYPDFQGYNPVDDTQDTLVGFSDYISKPFEILA